MTLRESISKLGSRRRRAFVSRDRSAAFEDVAVAPYSELLDGYRGASVHKGGPRWPEWDAQVFPRLCKKGLPCDTEPDAPDRTGEPIERLAWGGPIVRHFGHQVADFSTRLLSTRLARPDLDIGFAARFDDAWTTIDDAPGFVRAILDWHGIERDRTVFIREPRIVRELYVAEQAEQLGGPAPNDRHLDALDELTDRRLAGPSPEVNPLVYVSRAGMQARFAGESYIEELLVAAGARVIRPETMSLVEQMRAYHSTPQLVFAEGSALHALQLGGRLEADVVVLVRRAGMTLGRWSLEPRARSLAYLEVSERIVCGLLPSGAPAEPTGISLLSPDRLLDTFGPLGVDLRQRWDADAFGRAVEADVREWLHADGERRGGGSAESDAEIIRRLRAGGLEGLAREAPTILAARRTGPR